MTGGANAVRIPVIHREVGVIEGGSGPCAGGVTGRTSGREARGLVIRVCRPVVVRLVAAYARSRKRGVVIVHVAIGAGYGRVRTSQRESGRVVIECCSTPVRRAVAGVARRRESHLCVVGIGRSVVILLVARHARCIRGGQIIVAVHVAPATGCRGVCARQRKACGRVVEGATAPVRGRMALIASLWKARLHVIRVGRALEVCQVALRARSTGQLVIIVRMALRTLQRGVRTRQGKPGGRVVKGGGRPGSCGVALRASLREARRRVRRIVGRIEVVLVTTDARGVGGGQVVVPVHVALHALQARMSAGQREAGGRVIEARITPRRRRVALLAGLR